MPRKKQRASNGNGHREPEKNGKRKRVPCALCGALRHAGGTCEYEDAINNAVRKFIADVVLDGLKRLRAPAR